MLGVAATQVTVANLANSSQERNAIVIANEDGTLSRYEVGESALTSSDCDADGSQAICYGPQSNAYGNFTTAIGYAAQAQKNYGTALAITPMPVDVAQLRWVPMQMPMGSRQSL